MVATFWTYSQQEPVNPLHSACATNSRLSSYWYLANAASTTSLGPRYKSGSWWSTQWSEARTRSYSASHHLASPSRDGLRSYTTCRWVTT